MKYEYLTCKYLTDRELRTLGLDGWDLVTGEHADPSTMRSTYVEVGLRPDSAEVEQVQTSVVFIVATLKREWTIS